MTAREYYDLLLRQSGYSFREHLSDSEYRALAKRYRRMYPELTEDELFHRVKNDYTGHSEKLQPLFDDIVKNVPRKLKRSTPDVFVGEYPTNSINGTSMKAPGGGYLILLNWGLSKTMHEWAKLVISVLVESHKGLGSFRPDDSFQNIMVLMKQSLTAYVRNNELPAFSQYATDQKGILSGLLSAAAARFVIAHEYAHILAGHLDSGAIEQRRPYLWSRWSELISSFARKNSRFDDLPQPAPSVNFKDADPSSVKQSWAQELEADSIALSLLLHNSARDPDLEHKTRLIDIENTFAGVSLFFGIVNMIGLLQISPDLSSTHPLTVIRSEKANAFLDRKLDLSRYPYFRGIDSAVNKMARAIRGF
jgi:hypothetical protein